MVTGQDKDRERPLTSYHHGQNRLDSWKSACFNTNQIRER